MRLGRGVFTKGEDFSPCRLQASLTRSTAQMRTPFCDSESHRGALVLVATRSHFGSDVINVIHYRNAATLPLVPVPKKQKNNRAWKRGIRL